MEAGVKWVLRTDIMFQRVSCSLSSLAFSYRSDPRFIEADRNYRLSIALQKEGKPAESTAAFLAATELHAELASDRNQRRLNILTADLTTALSKDVWIEICLRADSLKDVLALGSVNSFFQRLVQTSTRLWYDLFLRRWPRGLSNPRTIAQFAQNLGDSVSFYTAFKTRYVADAKFRVVALDLTTNLGISSSETFSLFSTRVGYAAGHLWCAGEGKASFFFFFFFF